MEEQQYKLLDGKAVSAQIKQEMAEEVARIKATGGKIPHLAAILSVMMEEVKHMSQVRSRHVMRSVLIVSDPL